MKAATLIALVFSVLELFFQSYNQFINKLGLPSGITMQEYVMFLNVLYLLFLASLSNSLLVLYKNQKS